MQGSSGYDYDELLALSCDACSEQVRQNKLSTSGISYGAYVVSSLSYVVSKEPYEEFCYSQATCSYAKKLFNEVDWRGDGEIQEKESPLFLTVHT